MIIPLDLPPEAEAEVIGELYEDYATEDLHEDLLQIRMPGDYFIDVGFYPEHDRVNGKFMIVVFQHDWENRIFTTHAEDPPGVVACVRGCVEYIMSLSAPRVSVKGTSSSASQKPARGSFGFAFAGYSVKEG